MGQDNFPLGMSGNGPPARALNDANNVLHLAVVLEQATVVAPGANTLQPISSGNPLPVSFGPAASGGASIFRQICGATTNAANIKASAGQVYGILVSNVNAAARFLKLYNSATAPTAGAGTPVMTIMIPGNATGAGVFIQIPVGIAFSLGIGMTLTGAQPDADTTVVSAGDCVTHVFYA